MFDSEPFFHGEHGKVLQWIKDFLGNITQQIVLNGQRSGSISVTSGVPQGAVMGPFFMMFVSDIPSIVSSLILMFVDDMKIFHFVRSSDDHVTLQYDLNLLHEWLVHWQLKFNISKCKHVHFGIVHHNI